MKGIRERFATDQLLLTTLFSGLSGRHFTLFPAGRCLDEKVSYPAFR